VSIRISRARERKEKMRKTFEELLKSNRYLIIIDAYRLKASMLAEVRRLQDKLGFKIKGGKKGVFLKAIENIYPGSIDNLKPKLEGEVLYIFTNENPFDISYELDKFEMDLEASPGDTAPQDIIIPEGNTGIPPGPIIGLFSSLNIPTKIIAGAIHVVKDTLVAKKGDKITPNLANILLKLGIKPIKSKVNIRFAYDFKENVLIEREYLVPNIEAIKEEIEEAFINSFKIAVETTYIHETTIPILISKALLNAKTIAIESEYIDEDTIIDLMGYAVSKALLIKMLTGL